MRARILRAFGISDEEWAEFEASPQHQSYLAAKADADAEREAWLEHARAFAADLSAEISRAYPGAVLVLE